MQSFRSDGFVRDEYRTLGQDELARACGLEREAVDYLVAQGALEAIGRDARGPVFGASQLPVLQQAARLQAEHGLDLFTLALLVRQLQRIARLERELRRLRAKVGQAPLLPREGPACWREPHA